MNNIEVKVLHESHECPAGMMMFLANLTQKGHNINSMNDLEDLYSKCLNNHKSASAITKLPHGTIKRFAPITIAIVGASRRFLAQARTHQVGLDFVSASLQYSDYSGGSRFVVPYELTKLDTERNHDDWIPGFNSAFYTQAYLDACVKDMEDYELLIKAGVSNDTAGYKAPQGLRNVLIIQGNHQSWDYFIRLRACNRNTEETKYVTTLIWNELLKTEDGTELFKYAGPDCCHGNCREGKMSCGKPITTLDPIDLIEKRWPLCL